MSEVFLEWADYTSVWVCELVDEQLVTKCEWCLLYLVCQFCSHSSAWCGCQFLWQCTHKPYHMSAMETHTAPPRHAPTRRRVLVRSLSAAALSLPSIMSLKEQNFKLTCHPVRILLFYFHILYICALSTGWTPRCELKDATFEFWILNFNLNSAFKIQKKVLTDTHTHTHTHTHTESNSKLHIL